MIVFPHCKINLGLQVLSKRPDGFHDLQSVFFPVPLKDALEIIPIKGETLPSVEFTSSGLPIEGPAFKNLCMKAYSLLSHYIPDIPPVKMHLHKAIPMGAGLGGGSSDAAFALTSLNTVLDLGLPEQKLHQYALQLGSDCPYFLSQSPALVTGRGENIEPISLDLSAYQLVLVNPGIHIPTPWAFGQLKRSEALNAVSDAGAYLKALMEQPVSRWKGNLSNDFEQPVFAEYPAIEAVKQNLYNLGAVYASMSGSGSTVYGLFDKGRDVKTDFPDSYFVGTMPL